MPFCKDCVHYRGGEDYPRPSCVSPIIQAKVPGTLPRKPEDTPTLAGCFERKPKEEIVKLKLEWHGIGIDIKKTLQKIFKKK